MKKIILLLLIISFRLFSQDTMRFNSGEIKVVKVTEVGVHEVKYNRFDNLDGPVYVSSKNDIRSIKYSSGHLDTFSEEKHHPPAKGNSPNVSPRVNVMAGNDFIEIHRRRLFYRGNVLGEYRLMKLIVAYPNSTTANIMLNEFKTMKDYKSKQYLFGFVGLGLALASAIIGIAYTFSSLSYQYSNSDYAIGLIGIPIGITIGVTGGIISAVFKSKRHQKMIDIADIYNKGK